MPRSDLIVTGAVILFFGFLGYVVPIGDFGSATDVHSLCTSAIGQFGQVLSEEARKNCQFVKNLATAIYAMLGIGAILVIVGAILSRKSSYICQYCHFAASTEADLHNHYSATHISKEESQQPPIDSPMEEKSEILPKQKARKIGIRSSPILQGVIIGIIGVSIYWGIFAIISQNTYHMANDGMAPTINRGDVFSVEKVPASDINKADIIVFYDPTGEFGSKVGRVFRVVDNGQLTFYTLGDRNLASSTVTEEQYIGKVSWIIRGGEGAYSVYTLPSNLIIMTLLFVIPVIILKIRARKSRHL